MSQETTTTTSTVCYNHPDRETMLRCNRCERPICTQCAVLTPTGYRCKECVRGQQKVFDTAQWVDYPLAMIVAGVLSFIGSIAASYVGFFAIFIAPIVGVIVSEAVRWVIRRRRSKLLFQVATIAAVIGALPVPLLSLMGIVIGGGGAYSLISLLWEGIYTFLVASTTYYRLSGIQIR